MRRCRICGSRLRLHEFLHCVVRREPLVYHFRRVDGDLGGRAERWQCSRCCLRSHRVRLAIELEGALRRSLQAEEATPCAAPAVEAEPDP